MSEKVRIESVKVWEGNRAIYNAPTDDRLIKLANSIKRLGQLEPIIISTDGFIISGHTRYAAMMLLDKKFINVEYGNISSTDTNFTKLIIEYNNHRVKTDREKMNEIKAELTPGEYQKKSYELRYGALSCDLVEGNIKANRYIPDSNVDLANAIVQILKENIEYRPLSVRAIHYLLINKRPLIPVRDPEPRMVTYAGESKFYQKASQVCTSLRVNGHIPFDWIIDNTRKVDLHRGWESKEAFIEHELEYLLRRYKRNLLQTQTMQYYLIVEKETVANLVNPIANKYGLPVAYIKGNSSIDIRNTIIRDTQLNGNRPLFLFFVTDFDPAGFRIQDSFVGSLRNDFGQDVTAVRVMVTSDQIAKYNLPGDQEAKESDKQYKDFVRKHGTKYAYELEALKPGDFIHELDFLIRGVIDMDLYNEQIEACNQDEEAIQIKRQQILSVI